MKITQDISDDRVRLAFEGRLDASWSASAAAALDEAIRSGRARIELDLAAVSFVSSVGIGAILRAHARFRTVKGTLVIVAAGEPVRDMLRISKLDFLVQSGPAAARAQAAPLAHAPRPFGAIDARGTGWTGEIEAITAENERGSVEFVRDARVTLDAHTIALGHFALATTVEDASGLFGEGLAAGGTVAVAPAGAPRPDCLASSPDGRPTERFVGFVVREGLVVRGRPALRGHFERSVVDRVTLRSLATAIVSAAGGPVGFVAIGECGGALGAWARVSPDAWPRAVRDMSHDEMRAHLRFAGEPMDAGDSLAVVAVACTPGQRQMLPTDVAEQLVDCGPCLMHAHVATVSYRPVPRTTHDIIAAGTLLAEQPLRSVMHAIHIDDHPDHPKETTLVRGSFWATRIGQPDGARA